MRAIDTNILVRYLTADQPEQAAATQAVIAAGNVFIPTTVLLESEWVLRSFYRLSRRDIFTALRALAGLPGIFLENPAHFAQALSHAENGMDFADALHLSAASHCNIMLTFDQQFIQAATGTHIPVSQP